MTITKNVTEISSIGVMGIRTKMEGALGVSQPMKGYFCL